MSLTTLIMESSSSVDSSDQSTSSSSSSRRSEIKSCFTKHPSLKEIFEKFIINPPPQKARSGFSWLNKFINFLNAKPSRWDKSMPENIEDAVSAEALGDEQFDLLKEGEKIKECLKIRSASLRRVKWEENEPLKSEKNAPLWLQNAITFLSRFETQRLKTVFAEEREIWQQEIEARHDFSSIYKIPLSEDEASKALARDLARTDRLIVQKIIYDIIGQFLKDETPILENWEAFNGSCTEQLLLLIKSSKDAMEKSHEKTSLEAPLNLSLEMPDLPIYFEKASMIHLKHVLESFMYLLVAKGTCPYTPDGFSKPCLIYSRALQAM